MERYYTYPHEKMFGEYQQYHLQSHQSKYHNLGMNGFMLPPRTVYPGKKIGMSGDYGPRQQGIYNANDVYPLDAYSLAYRGVDPYTNKCGLIDHTGVKPLHLNGV